MLLDQFGVLIGAMSKFDKGTALSNAWQYVRNLKRSRGRRGSLSNSSRVCSSMFWIIEPFHKIGQEFVDIDQGPKG